MPDGGGLLGRDEELRAVRATLTGAGCVIAGPAGVGKSRLAADAVRAESTTGRRVVRILATRAAASMPFGAFLHLATPGSGGAVPAIPELLAAVRDDGAPLRTLLVVDDAHLLDEASAALLLAIATTETATVVATVRSQESTPDAVTALWKERWLVRYDLQPLAPSEVRTLVDDLLGGPAGALVHDWAVELSQGNPLYVTELVEDARRTGGLHEVEGRWQLSGDGPSFDRLNDLIGAHVRTVSADAARALEVLAIGAPLPLAQLERLAPRGAADELERARLVVLAKDGGSGTWVELAHPLYGEVVSADLSELTARRIRQDLAEALIEAGPTGEVEELRVATWLLEAGVVDAERFLPAAAVALRRGAPELANRLAAAVDGGLDAALARAQAHNGLAQFHEVEPVLAPFEAEAATAPGALAASYVETRYRALLRGDEEDASGAEAFLLRAATWRDDRDWEALVATQEAWALLYDSRPRSARDRLLPFLDDTDLDPLRRFHVIVVSEMAAVRLAVVDDCEALEARLRNLLDELDDAPPWEVGIGLSLAGAARVNAARDLDGASERFQRDRAAAQAAGDRPAAATALYMLGYLSLMRGRPRTAANQLLEAIDLLSLGDPLNNLPGTFTSLARALAMAGDAKGADRALASAAASTRPAQERRLRPHTERAKAAVEVARGQVSAARTRLLALAEDAGEDVITEAEALHDALRLGADPSHCADRLEALAAEAQDHPVHLFARQARAMVDDSVADQITVAEELEALGLDLLAAEAAQAAGTAATRQALRDASRRAAALAARCTERCEGAVLPFLSGTLDAPQLTAREREIAGLAARGMSNVEIADVLVLSVRSVETYVLRACRKLGVTSRTELPSVLGDSERST